MAGGRSGDHTEHIAGSAGDLLGLIRSGEATTRAALASTTGLARSTIAQRIEQLVERKLVVEISEAPTTGCRTHTIKAINKQSTKHKENKRRTKQKRITEF